MNWRIALIGHLILISSDQFTETKFVARAVQRCLCHLKCVKAVAPLISRHYERAYSWIQKINARHITIQYDNFLSQALVLFSSEKAGLT